MSEDRGPEAAAAPSQRLDKWLWFARVVKSRTLAAKLVQEGKVRVNRERIARPSQPVKAGDVLTATVHHHVRVLRIVDVGHRRGPAQEARSLYEDLSLPDRTEDGPECGSSGGTGAHSGPRPDARGRREARRLKSGTS